MDKNKIIKPLLLVTAIIIFSSIFVRIFSGSETLAENAAKNPKSAQAETETQASNRNGDPDITNGQHSMDTDGINANPDINADTINANPGINADTINANPSMYTDTINANPSMDADSINANPSMDADSINANPGIDASGINGCGDTAANDRVIYKDGFYYEPLSQDLIKKITGISYPVAESEKDSITAEAFNTVNSSKDIQISYSDLCYMSVLHYNFHGVERTGELICNKAIAQDLVEIFYELYRNEYQIEQIRLIDEYGGDDTLSMLDNNTSCFNYRVVDGASSLSKHAMGLAIDINPFFNPYIVFKADGTTYISPQGSEAYVDRSQNFAYKIDENDLCYQLFKEHGFIWGGNWNSCKDYQHFQKVPE